MDDNNWDDEDENLWWEQSYLDHTNDFNERFRENLKKLRREIYGRLVDDKLSNWMIDVVIAERHLVALEHLGSENYYEDDVLGKICLNWNSEYLVYINEQVKLNREFLGKRIGEIIARAEHNKILKLSRSLINVTEKLKLAHENECPAEVLVQILREDYRNNHSININKEELFIELGNRGISITEKQFRGLLERMNFNEMS
ncbi:hypothetical protein OAK16_04560 [Verrucomicrobia bacterium]|nr:hypothetical protein [Verrucomicrobiota bacterium]